MAHVGAVSLDVFAKLLCNACVAFEEVFACHALFAGCAARGDDVFCVGECFLYVGCEGEVNAFEAAVAHFFNNALKARCVNVVEADVGGEVHHGCRLCHV